MEKSINTIKDLVTGLEKHELDSSLPNLDILQQAINDFQNFSNAYEGYFEQIIADKTYKATNTTGTRLKYQYTQTLQSYWSPLEQVILQWRVVFYRNLLEQAHTQSEYYLGKLGMPTPGLLIYFNKVASIRYLPYTRIPILGIPHSFSGPERWSAIPHELGHYIFWNLGDKFGRTREIQKQLKEEAKKYLAGSEIDEQQIKFVIPWLEEVFSDIVGTRIDNLNFAASSDEFVRSQAGNENDLVLNDGHHPPLSIRPFVWEHALKFSKKNMKSLSRDQLFGSFSGLNVRKLRIKLSTPLISDENPLRTNIVLDDQNFETLSVDELLPAVERLVEFLSNQLDKILAGISYRTEDESSFQGLKKFLESEQLSLEKLKGQDIYELLLKPRILEEGYTHTHGIWTPHGWHESTTHNH